MPKQSHKLTVKEVAARFRVTTRTVRRWIERGHFPNAAPVEGLDYSTAPILIPEDDVIAYEKKLASPPSGGKAS